MGNYNVSYRVYGSVEIEALSQEDAERKFSESVSNRELVDGLSFDGDDIDVTKISLI